MTTPYTLTGIESSPYSVKVRAVLRYRHLPYRWICRMPQFEPAFADLRPMLMPVLDCPDGSRRVDSTPILLELESRHPGQRSIQPPDPALDLYSRLIEDMADEWLTKCLFHYRFSNDADRAYAPLWVMDDSHPGAGVDEIAALASAFLERQSARMPLVGALPENGAVLEASFRRLLAILEPAVALDRFLFGSRPSLADFGLYAQLKTMCTDPTPMALVRREAPRLEHWVRRADDLSGVTGAWQDTPGPTATVVALLRLAGDTYLPFLAANADAVANEAAAVEVRLADGAYRQRPFGYQAKCLAALRACHATLPAEARRRADTVLEETGCLAILRG